MPTARPIAFLLVLSLCTLAACEAPEPPVDAPPAPQATELRDAIRAPMDKARGVEDTLQDGADRQRAAIDAAGG
ncbi:MAG TPA: hypothetical protein VLK29_06620 [Luteimonas sp.]|nr:hypothetical protein [Luteimonas sp.]